MKFTKMSLVAALLIGSSAFAIENTKVTGDVNVFYSTSDAAGQTSNIIGGQKVSDRGSLFEKDSSAADVALNLNLTSDLYKNDMVSISTGAGYTALTTLGLENSLVSNVWGGAHTATAPTGASYGTALGGAKVENASWVNEAWLAATAGKTTLKAGRMVLDTPLAFTETWSIEKNTFEGAVLLNQDIPDTTLVAAFIGNGNGTETFGTGNATVAPGLPTGSNMLSNVSTLGLAIAPVVNANGDFATYGTDGAYAVAVVNNSWKPLTAQAWYYDVSRLAQAYWLQADLNIMGILAGAQYTSATLDSGLNVTGPAGDASSTYALMLGYEMKDVFTAKVAYSSVDSDGAVGAANTATSTGASKLYTEAWWMYGKVTGLDTNSFNVTVTSPVNGLFDLGLYYTQADQASKVIGLVETQDNDLTEFDLTVGKSFGPLDATLAYIYADVENHDDSIDNDSNTVQVYLTLNF